MSSRGLIQESLAGIAQTADNLTFDLFDFYRETDRVKEQGLQVPYGENGFGWLTPDLSGTPVSETDLRPSLPGIQPIVIRGKESGELCLGISASGGYENNFLICWKDPPSEDTRPKDEKPKDPPPPPPPPPGGDPPPAPNSLIQSCADSKWVEEHQAGWKLVEIEVKVSREKTQNFQIQYTEAESKWVLQKTETGERLFEQSYEKGGAKVIRSATRNDSYSIKIKFWVLPPRSTIRLDRIVTKYRLNSGEFGTDWSERELFFVCAKGVAVWNKNQENGPRNEDYFEIFPGIQKIYFYGNTTRGFFRQRMGTPITSSSADSVDRTEFLQPGYESYNSNNYGPDSFTYASELWKYAGLLPLMIAGNAAWEKYGKKKVVYEGLTSGKIVGFWHQPASFNEEVTRGSMGWSDGNDYQKYLPQPSDEGRQESGNECEDDDMKCCSEQTQMLARIAKALGVQPSGIFMRVPETLVQSTTKKFGIIDQDKMRDIKSQSEFNVYLLEQILALLGQWQIEIEVPASIQDASKSEANHIPDKIVLPDVRSALEMLIRLNLNTQDDEQTARSYQSRMLLEIFQTRLAALDAAHRAAAVLDWTQAETVEERVEVPVTFTVPNTNKNLDSIDRDEEIKAFLKESKIPIKRIKYKDKFSGFKQFMQQFREVRAIVRATAGTPISTRDGVNGVKLQIKQQIKAVDENVTGGTRDDNFKQHLRELERLYGVKIEIVP